MSIGDWILIFILLIVFIIIGSVIAFFIKVSHQGKDNKTAAQDTTVKKKYDIKMGEAPELVMKIGVAVGFFFLPWFLLLVVSPTIFGEIYDKFGVQLIGGYYVLGIILYFLGFKQKWEDNTGRKFFSYLYMFLFLLIIVNCWQYFGSKKAADNFLRWEVGDVYIDDINDDDAVSFKNSNISAQATGMNYIINTKRDDNIPYKAVIGDGLMKETEENISDGQILLIKNPSGLTVTFSVAGKLKKSIMDRKALIPWPKGNSGQLRFLVPDGVYIQYAVVDKNTFKI